MLSLTACNEEKLYTVEELKENHASAAESINNPTKIENLTEIDLQNYLNAEKVAFELTFGHLREFI